jgi:hypothetical protein
VRYAITEQAHEDAETVNGQRSSWESARALPAGSLVVAHHDGPGIGILVDCPLPGAGMLRLIHWLRSPYRQAPNGIVEDADSIAVSDLLPDHREPHWACHGTRPLPAGRLGATNWMSADGQRIAGLRGWDIPHDRHVVLTTIATGMGALSPILLPHHWARSWSIELKGAGEDAPVTAFHFTHGENARV